MANYLQKPIEYFAQGLREFSEHSVRHSRQAVTNLVKDYWDVAAAILAGYAINDYKSETFGEWRPYLMVLPAIASMLNTRGDSDRFTRNFYAGLAALTFWWTKGIEGVPESSVIANKAMGILSGGFSAYMDYAIRRKKKINSESSQQKTNGGRPLEKLIN